MRVKNRADFTHLPSRKVRSHRAGERCAVTGIGSIAAASMGSMSMVVVAVAAFIYRSFISLFYGPDYFDFEAR